MSAPLPLHDTLGSRRVRGVLLAASRDPDAKVTFLVTPTASGPATGLVCKVPTTETARSAVRREAQALVELRRLGLDWLSATTPRYVSSTPKQVGGPVRPGPPTELLVSTQVPGQPMSVGYHRWRHTSRPGPVTTDLDLALGWLTRLWQDTTVDAEPLTWAGEVADEVARRWDGTPQVDAASEHLRAAHAELARHQCPRTVVHGDYWCGNVLVDGTAVSGVVDWEASQPQGWPVRDVTRFLLSYSLYLDRHTRPGRPVPGHPGLHRGQNGDAVAYALLGDGWYPRLVRRRLADSLARLGLPRHLWYAVALTGIGEVAATANHEGFGRDHLLLLASLPRHPRRPGSAR